MNSWGGQSLPFRLHLNGISHFLVTTSNSKACISHLNFVNVGSRAVKKLNRLPFVIGLTPKLLLQPENAYFMKFSGLIFFTTIFKFNLLLPNGSSRISYLKKISIC